MGKLAARSTGWWLAFLGGLLVLLTPLLIVEVPPLMDYPNHLARTWLLAFGAEDPVLSQMYRQEWHVIPNLAVDVVLPPLLWFLPVHVAGRVMLGLILLLNYVAIVIYSRVAFGSRSWWPLAAALMGYNALFLMGFMNFLASLGMALLTAAGWAAFRERHPVLTVAGATLAATVVFFCHIFGLLFCAILIGSHELAAAAREWRPAAHPIRRTLLRGLAAGIVFLPSAVLFLSTRLTDARNEVSWPSLADKLRTLVAPFSNYYAALDKLTALALLVFLAVCAWRRAVRVPAASAIAMAACLGLYLVMPFSAGEAFFVDARFPVMLGMLLFAGVLPILPRPSARIAGLAIAALFLLRMGLVSALWWGHNQDIADIRRSIAPVPPGSRVLVATVDPDVNPAWWRSHNRRHVIADFCRTDQHLGALLTIERRAFWPVLFTIAAQQPLVVRPPYDRISEPVGDVPDYHLLDPGAVLPRHTSRPAYLAHWASDFDYVLVLNAGGMDGLSEYLADRLEPLNRTPMAALFRVRPSASVDATGHGGDRSGANF